MELTLTGERTELPFEAFDGAVRIEPVPGGVPAIVRPLDPLLASDTDHFVGWFAASKEQLDHVAATHGALLFRGFPVSTTEDFSRAIAHYPTNDLTYIGGATPRGQLAPRIYESTTSPQQMYLAMHQEMAYLPSFPRMIAFWSHRSAWAGGETLLADFREMRRRVPQHLLEQIAARGVRYERNFRAPGDDIDPVLGQIHKPWTLAFATDDPAEAERACRSVGLEPIWREDGSLSTAFTAPGFVEHPITGETVWFNHVASQSADHHMFGPVWEQLDAFYGADRPRPYRTTFGDGGAFDPADIDELYRIFESITHSLRWSDGDLLLIDNIMTAHGRNPYEGERDLQVALLG
jgi:alpha-ketoglutarate-dependent taurine dioxygenase